MPEQIGTDKNFVDDFAAATECGFGRRRWEQIPALVDIHRDGW
ncbi:MAG: hypothetical protein RIE22_07170 [Alphaproteobacteria bacterium]